MGSIDYRLFRLHAIFFGEITDYGYIADFVILFSYFRIKHPKLDYFCTGLDNWLNSLFEESEKRKGTNKFNIF